MVWYCPCGQLYAGIRKRADALYEDQGIADAEFRLTGGGESGTFTTDTHGQIRLDRLKKNTSYTLRQTAAAPGYTQKAETVRFAVSEDGRIGGEAYSEITAVCRKIRITVSVTDSIFRNSISGTGVALCNSAGETVKLWTTSAVPEEIDNLEPGTYTIQVNGKNIPIEVLDTEEIQHFAPMAWSTEGILSFCGVAAVVLVAAGALLRSAWEKKRKRGGRV